MAEEEESTKVRLVRCPKCENLLPELADYSIYQCGGCGAVLRAKNKNQGGVGLMEKSSEGVVGVVAEVRISQDKGVVDSDMEVKLNSGSLNSEDDKNKKQQQPEKDGDDDSWADRSRNQSKAKSGKLVVEDGLDVIVDSNDFGDLARKERRDWVALSGYTSESSRTGRILSLHRQDRGDMEGFRRTMKREVQGMGISTSDYRDEGPSTHDWNSSYHYREGFGNQDYGGGDGREDYLDKDRVELLRKVEELKEQLSRSGLGSDNPKDNPPFNQRVTRPDHHHGPDPWYPGGSSASNGTAVQFLPPVNRSAAIPHFGHHPEPYTYSHNHPMSTHGFHSSLPKPNHVAGYGDLFGPQVLRRDQHQAPGQYQQPHHQYFSANYFDTNPDLFEPYASNGTFHHPTCSCFHCYNKHHGVPATLPPSNLSNQRFPDFSNRPIMHHQEIPRRAFGPSIHQPRSSIPAPLRNHGPQSHSRWSSDVNSHVGGFVHGPPPHQNVVLPSIGRRCHPIAGGAPFLTCCNCFELLRIPRKVLLSAKKPQSARCGSCSTVINFSIVNSKLVLSFNKEAEQAADETDNCSRLKMVDKSPYSYSNIRRTNLTFSSDDYDNSGYDFQAVDADPIESSMGHGLNATKAQDMQTFRSSSSSLSEEENGLEALNGPKEGTISVQKPAVPSPPIPGSPLQEYFDYSNCNHQLGKGNRSSRFDQEKAITDKATARQNSMKEESLATETDVSFCEDSINGVSHETALPIKEDNTPKNIKGVESFFANLVKNSFKDVTKSNQTDDRIKNEVSVNGHVISRRLVKKAEKLAGPINPGHYWYDSLAGFWGVMGGPGLGMIPPAIKELKYPMPANCSGGNTGIFVNGRELHKKDLDLLASRGLPTEGDRSYIIEISGRVVDEDTGQELEIGKLAPTVEREKHGFGMKVPRMATQSKSS